MARGIYHMGMTLAPGSVCLFSVPAANSAQGAPS
jgi:hypothetical protein